MNLLKNLFNKKRKEKERLNQERQTALDSNLQRTTKVQEQSAEIQEKNLDIQKSTMEIAWKNQEQGDKLTNLILDNERTRNLLLDRENKIKAQQDEFDERQKKVRQEEIELTARKAEIRKNEHLMKEEQNHLQTESIWIAKREAEAEMVKTESESKKEKYQSLYEELEAEKGSIKKIEEEARRKNNDADEKIAIANASFEKAKVIDGEIKAKETKFEEHREAIEKSLNEKIAEYDRRLEDLNAVQGIIDDVKFDKSQEGKEAKIVVKEAIRQAKKSLADIKTKFEELDEKYSSGTFKGFSTPIAEIDTDFVELKKQYIQIKEHIESQENLPHAVSKWLDKIEECIINADKCLKSWEFSEAFRNILGGLVTCKNYESLLIILRDYEGDTNEESSVPENDDFHDWYLLLEIDLEATEDEINKHYKNLIKIYHPDLAPDDKKEEYTAKTVLLNQAKEVLTDIAKRREFDEKRNNRKHK